MFKLIALGVISGAFFSTTFVLNELMSTSGGHWFWSASLRYFFMVLFLATLIVIRQGPRQLKSVFILFFQHWKFWVCSGGVGFGCFYALICFSADFSPGWVIAATWQFTVVASLFILMMFGRKFPKKIWGYSSLIFLGVLLVNVSHIDDFELRKLIMGGLPVLVAAFCYPFGNQLIWEATSGENSKVAQIDSPLLTDVFNKVFLMTLGSIPLWGVLMGILTPPLPSPGQVVNCALVAFFSGICATSIFLYARNLAKTSNELAGVDATQASEVIFAFIGGMVLIGGEFPEPITYIGLAMILVGLIFFVRIQNN